MIPSVKEAVRLRLAKSERIVNALDGVFSDSAVVLPSPDSRVLSGSPEKEKRANRMFVVPIADLVDKEVPRSDGGVVVFCYEKTEPAAMLCALAVEREVTDPRKGCLVVVSPPVVIVKQWYCTSHGTAVREADESRLWVADPTIEMIWLAQPPPRV